MFVSLKVWTHTTFTLVWFTPVWCTSANNRRTWSRPKAAVPVLHCWVEGEDSNSLFALTLPWSKMPTQPLHRYNLHGHRLTPFRDNSAPDWAEPHWCRGLYCLSASWSHCWDSQIYMYYVSRPWDYFHEGGHEQRLAVPWLHAFSKKLHVPNYWWFWINHSRTP